MMVLHRVFAVRPPAGRWPAGQGRRPANMVPWLAAAAIGASLTLMTHTGAWAGQSKNGATDAARQERLGPAADKTTDICHIERSAVDQTADSNQDSTVGHSDPGENLLAVARWVSAADAVQPRWGSQERLIADPMSEPHHRQDDEAHDEDEDEDEDEDKGEDEDEDDDEDEDEDEEEEEEEEDEEDEEASVSQPGPWNKRLMQLERLLDVHARRMSQLEQENARLREELQRSRVRAAQFQGRMGPPSWQRGEGDGRGMPRPDNVRPRQPEDAPEPPRRPRASAEPQARQAVLARMENQVVRLEQQLAQLEERREQEKVMAEAKVKREMERLAVRREFESEERHLQQALRELELQRRRLAQRAQHHRNELELKRLEQDYEQLEPESDAARGVAGQLEELRLQLQLQREEAALMERELELQAKADEVRAQAQRGEQEYQIHQKARAQNEEIHARHIQERRRLEQELEQLRRQMTGLQESKEDQASHPE